MNQVYELQVFPHEIRRTRKTYTSHRHPHTKLVVGSVTRNQFVTLIRQLLSQAHAKDLQLDARFGTDRLPDNRARPSSPPPHAAPGSRREAGPPNGYAAAGGAAHFPPLPLDATHPRPPSAQGVEGLSLSGMGAPASFREFPAGVGGPVGAGNPGFPGYPGVGGGPAGGGGGGPGGFLTAQSFPGSGGAGGSQQLGAGNFGGAVNPETSTPNPQH